MWDRTVLVNSLYRVIQILCIDGYYFWKYAYCKSKHSYDRRMIEDRENFYASIGSRGCRCVRRIHVEI